VTRSTVRSFLLGLLALAGTATQPAQAEGALTLRDRLIFASSTTASRVADLLAGSFADR